MVNTGNEIVDKMQTFVASGNVIPPQWFKTIVKESGKPNLNAIIILSDIVYWYKPQVIRDENTGMIVAVKKRFKADLLQRNYQQFAEQFGITKRDATNAIVELEKLGVIKRHFRKVTFKEGIVAVNVLFIELIPEKLFELTSITQKSDTCHETDGVSLKSGRGCHSNRGEGVTQIGETNTEITIQRLHTEITTHQDSCGGGSKYNSNLEGKQETESPPPPQPPRQSAVRKFYSTNIHPLASPIEAEKLDDLEERYGEDWVIAAITEAVENNARSLRYIEAVLKAWAEKGRKNTGYRKQAKQEEVEDDDDDLYHFLMGGGKDG